MFRYTMETLFGNLVSCVQRFYIEVVRRRSLFPGDSEEMKLRTI